MLCRHNIDRVCTTPVKSAPRLHRLKATMKRWRLDAFETAKYMCCQRATGSLNNIDKRYRSNTVAETSSPSIQPLKPKPTIGYKNMSSICRLSEALAVAEREVSPACYRACGEIVNGVLQQINGAEYFIFDIRCLDNIQIPKTRFILIHGSPKSGRAVSFLCAVFSVKHE